MRKVRCYDCGKSYDYDEDGFCPSCGAFNPPRQDLRIGADGSVVRVDGLNEVNHVNSFVHQELHEEKRARRRAGLDKSVQRIQRPSSRATTPKQAPVTLQSQTDRRARQQKSSNPFSVVVWIIILIVIFNLLSRIFFFL